MICLPVWRDRVRCLGTDLVYVVRCWLISPDKLNLPSWLLAYLADK